MFLYTNPIVGKYLLLPHCPYQYLSKWALHDMGAHYPNPTGRNDGLNEPVPEEESKNHLLTAFSYTRKSGDKSLIAQYVRSLAAQPSSTVLNCECFQSRLLDQ